MDTELTGERADAYVSETAADSHHGTAATNRGFAGRALPPSLRAGAATWIWFGILVAVAGFILIAVGWGQVAAETQVHLQLPYIVSAALVGLGLVMLGLTVLNIATRQRDGVDRDRQIAQLVTIMEELRDTLEERERP